MPHQSTAKRQLDQGIADRYRKAAALGTAAAQQDVAEYRDVLIPQDGRIAHRAVRGRPGERHAAALAQVFHLTPAVRQPPDDDIQKTPHARADHEEKYAVENHQGLRHIGDYRRNAARTTCSGALHTFKPQADDEQARDMCHGRERRTTGWPGMRISMSDVPFLGAGFRRSFILVLTCDWSMCSMVSSGLAAPS